MGSKLQVWKGRIEFVIDLIKDFPKISASVLTIILLAGYIITTRTPAALSCTWQAVVVQSVPWDKWQYNWMANQCQYHNGTRYIPLNKVMDVGMNEDEATLN